MDGFLGSDEPVFLGEDPNLGNYLPWSMLKLMFIMNLVVAFMGMAVALDVVIITPDCALCSEDTKLSSYTMTGIALGALLICALFQIFALMTNCGK